MVKGLFHTGNQISLPVIMAKNENIPVMFSLASQGTKVSSTPVESEKPDGSSVQVLYSSFCDRE